MSLIPHKVSFILWQQTVSQSKSIQSAPQLRSPQAPGTQSAGFQTRTRSGRALGPGDPQSPENKNMLIMFRS